MSMEAMAAAEAGKVLVKAFEAFTEYQKTREQEVTERQRIRATVEVAVKQIESNRIIFEKYMESSFNEREKLYKKVEDTLNTATARGDVEMAKLALNFIVTIYNKNPLEGIEKMQNSISAGAIRNYLE